MATIATAAADFVPDVVAVFEPDESYPERRSVVRWIEGEHPQVIDPTRPLTRAGRTWPWTWARFCNRWNRRRPAWPLAGGSERKPRLGCCAAPPRPPTYHQPVVRPAGSTMRGAALCRRPWLTGRVRVEELGRRVGRC